MDLQDLKIVHDWVSKRLNDIQMRGTRAADIPDNYNDLVKVHKKVSLAMDTAVEDFLKKNKLTADDNNAS